MSRPPLSLVTDPVPGDRARTHPAPADPDVVDAPPASVTLAELEERVVGEAGRLAAATCRWLLLLAEFDRREGWARSSGLRSTVHWLSWRCGIGRGTAAEHVRVARVLAELPLVVDAFACGRLSYSQVRALTRAAGLLPEAELLRVAEQCTGAQLERLVTGLRRAASAGEERERHRARTARWFVDDDGSVVIRARLSGDEGALVVAALDAALGVVTAEPDPAEPGSELDGEREPAERAARCRADSLVELARVYAESARGDRRVDAPDPVEVVLYADLAALAEAARVAAGDGPTHGSGSSAEDDADGLRMLATADPRAGDGEAAQRPPGGPAASLVGLPGRSPAGAERSSAGDGQGSAGAERSSAEGGRTPAGEERSSAGDSRARCHLEGVSGVHPSVLARLLCDRQIRLVAELGDGRGVDLGRSRRLAGARLRAAVLRRDAHACRYPGCGSRRHLHLHHVRHWICGGRTDADNLVTLCGFHHRRLHDEAFTIGITDRCTFTFGLPDGTRVMAHPEVHPSVGRPPLATDPALLGSDAVAREAAQTLGRGQTLHLDYAVSTLLAMDPAG